MLSNDEFAKLEARARKLNIGVATAAYLSVKRSLQRS
jgi:hypothetical protein